MPRLGPDRDYRDSTLSLGGTEGVRLGTPEEREARLVEAAVVWIDRENEALAIGRRIGRAQPRVRPMTTALKRAAYARSDRDVVAGLRAVGILPSSRDDLERWRQAIEDTWEEPGHCFAHDYAAKRSYLRKAIPRRYQRLQERSRRESLVADMSSFAVDALSPEEQLVRDQEMRMKFETLVAFHKEALPTERALLGALLEHQWAAAAALRAIGDPDNWSRYQSLQRKLIRRLQS